MADSCDKEQSCFVFFFSNAGNRRATRVSPMSDAHKNKSDGVCGFKSPLWRKHDRQSKAPKYQHMVYTCLYAYTRGEEVSIERSRWASEVSTAVNCTSTFKYPWLRKSLQMRPSKLGRDGTEWLCTSNPHTSMT